MDLLQGLPLPGVALLRLGISILFQQSYWMVCHSQMVKSYLSSTCLPGGGFLDPLHSLCCWSLIYPPSRSKDNQWSVNKGGEPFTQHTQDLLWMGHRQIQIVSYNRENISSDPEWRFLPLGRCVEKITLKKYVGIHRNKEFWLLQNSTVFFILLCSSFEIKVRIAEAAWARNLAVSLRPATATGIQLVHSTGSRDPPNWG